MELLLDRGAGILPIDHDREMPCQLGQANAKLKGTNALEQLCAP